MDESLRGPIVVAEVAALGVILAVVENTMVRVALGLIMALLLARAALASKKPDEGGRPPTGYDERRHDHLFRHWVDALLKRIREFHTICDSVREEKANITIAQMKLREIEAELLKLLNQVTDTAKPSQLRQYARRVSAGGSPTRKDEAYGEIPVDDDD